jgi:hypothetical protein
MEAVSRPTTVRKSQTSAKPAWRLDDPGKLELEKRMATSPPGRPALTAVGTVGLPERLTKAPAITWEKAAVCGIDRQQEQLGGE